jgi:hypothetical protein
MIETDEVVVHSHAQVRKTKSESVQASQSYVDLGGELTGADGDQLI